VRVLSLLVLFAPRCNTLHPPRTVSPEPHSTRAATPSPATQNRLVRMNPLVPYPTCNMVKLNFCPFSCHHSLHASSIPAQSATDLRFRSATHYQLPPTHFPHLLSFHILMTFLEITPMDSHPYEKTPRGRGVSRFPGRARNLKQSGTWLTKYDCPKPPEGLHSRRSSSP
jgi:hypothetical protein